MQNNFSASMNKEKAPELSKDIEQTLQNQIQTTKKTEQIINGQGFLNMKVNSQTMEIPQLELVNLDNFLSSFINGIQFGQEFKEKLIKFTKTLKKVNLLQWKKFEFLFTNPHGKGSWMGVYFRKIDEKTCEFYSNHINCAFTLVPDVYVIRQTQQKTFGPIKKTSESIYLVQRPRGLTRADVESVMGICEIVTKSKILSIKD